MFPEREKTCVDIYTHVFPALTLANDLLENALMKLSVSTFDISLPSQHLVFVFDAPKWLLVRPASVPALWNEQMLRRCSEPVDAVVTLLSGIRRALHLVVIISAFSLLELALFHCFHPVLLPDAAGQTYLPLCAHLRGDLYPFKHQPISIRATTISDADWERVNGTLSASAGSEMVLLTQLCPVGDMSAQKLPAGTFEGRNVWKLCFRCH